MITKSLSTIAIPENQRRNRGPPRDRRRPSRADPSHDEARRTGEPKLYDVVYGTFPERVTGVEGDSA